MISFLIAFPLLGIVMLLFFNGKKQLAVISFLITLIECIAAVWLYWNIDFDAARFQLIESFKLMEIFPFYYTVGIDALSFWMILLTAFLFPLVIAGGYTGITKNHKGYYIALLILESSIIGTFASLNLFLFYIFWELMLLPMFFIIGVWGGADRIYATIKFVLFTMFGSLLMFIAIIYIGIHYQTFDYEQLASAQFSMREQYWLFLAFALAFLIKVPIVPLHTWLPDAHTEAPAGGSVILAGVLLKLGAYGLIRVNLPLFPVASQHFSYAMCAIAVVGIIHGALTAAVQTDMKRLIAYSSVSHMGYIVLGIFTFTVSGLQGSILHMVNHALSTGALFFLVGMMYDQTHTRQISDYGGIAKIVPVFALFFMIATLSSIGLPGLNGFIGEFTILAASFGVYMELTIIAVGGIVLGAWYMLKLYGSVFYGEMKNVHFQDFRDARGVQIAVIIPMIALMFYLGLYPKAFLNSIKNSAQYHLEHIHKQF